MGYIRKEKLYTIEEVLSKRYLIPKKKKSDDLVDFDGNLVHMSSHRYQTFAEKGVKCVTCGIEGKYFALEKEKTNAKDRYHFNLYGFDANGNEIMLHIIAKVNGGENHIDNYQPMCAKCNSGKCDKDGTPAPDKSIVDYFDQIELERLLILINNSLSHQSKSILRQKIVKLCNAKRKEIVVENDANQELQ